MGPSESTLQRPTSPSAGADQAEPAAERRGWWRNRGALPVLLTAAGLLLLSLLLVLWAKTRPGFDPYGWLVWGHQTFHGGLDTNAAPSWKPLPYLFTLPYALAGHYQLWLWMVTSVAVSLAGVIFAARIAYTLTLRGPAQAEAALPARRWPAYAAGVFAGAALLGITDYWHYMLSNQSDPMIVTLSLGAIDCHLQRRFRWAFVLAALASLGRPEVWPFAGLYGLWCWRYVASMRWLLYAGLAVVLALWFGVPALTSRTPFVAASNALGSGRALHNDKIFGTVKRFTGLSLAPIEILALISVAIAALRRDLVTLAIAAVAALWVIVEIAFALHGWPGLPRYMFEAAGMMIVVAGVGAGRLLGDGFTISRLAGWAGVAVVAIAVVFLVPSGVSRARQEHKDIVAQRVRTKEIDRLTGTIRRLGGAAKLRQCGEPLTRLEYQTMLAWQLGVNVAKVGFKYSQAVSHGNPIVTYTPQADGWQVEAMHQVTPFCRSLPS